jgi:ribosomal protein S18 acetylase RimI-like enzyme
MTAIRLQRVDRLHPVCRELWPGATARSMGLPPGAFRFRKVYFLKGYSDGAIIAKDGGRLVGFFRYDRRVGSSTLQAVGTWVDPEYRRKGLAERMWRHAIRGIGIKRISVYTATNAGAALVQALAKKLSHLHAYT